MNWQIPDESLIETDITNNSNNDAISTDYLNGERSLETGWQRHDNCTTSSWGNSIFSTTNSG